MRSEYSELFSALQKLNVDVSGTVERFVGNDDIYVQFLNEFSETDRFPDIYKALYSRDTDKLIMHVHKLKGVAGNLGMKDIYNDAEAVIKQLRDGSYERTDEKLRAIEAKVSEISLAIKENKPNI